MMSALPYDIPRVFPVAVLQSFELEEKELILTLAKDFDKGMIFLGLLS